MPQIRIVLANTFMKGMMARVSPNPKFFIDNIEVLSILIAYETLRACRLGLVILEMGVVLHLEDVLKIREHRYKHSYKRWKRE